MNSILPLASLIRNGTWTHLAIACAVLCLIGGCGSSELAEFRQNTKVCESESANLVTRLTACNALGESHYGDPNGGAHAFVACKIAATLDLNGPDKVLMSCGRALANYFYTYTPTQRKLLANIAYRIVESDKQGSMHHRSDAYASSAGYVQSATISAAAESDHPDLRLIARQARAYCEGYAQTVACATAAKFGEEPDQAKTEAAAAARRKATEEEQADQEEDQRRQQADAQEAQSRAAMIGQLANNLGSIPTYTPAPIPRTLPTPVAPRTANGQGRPFVPPPPPPPRPVPSLSIPSPPAGGSPSSVPASGGGNSANAACVRMDSAVTAISQPLIGPGHCSGEVVGRITNHSSQRVYCRWDFYRNGMKKGDSGSTSIAPGQTIGGEGGGIWSCDADNRITFACVADTPQAINCIQR